MLEWTGGGRASVRRAPLTGTGDLGLGGRDPNVLGSVVPTWALCTSFDLKVPCTLHCWRRSTSTRVPFLAVFLGQGLSLAKVQPGTGGYLVDTGGYMPLAANMRARAVVLLCCCG